MLKEYCRIRQMHKNIKQEMNKIKTKTTDFFIR